MGTSGCFHQFSKFSVSQALEVKSRRPHFQKHRRSCKFISRVYFSITRQECFIHILWGTVFPTRTACAHSEDTRTGWSVVAICLKTVWIIGYPQSALRKLRSDCADAQADLSLCWTFMQFWKERCVPPHICSWGNCISEENQSTGRADLLVCVECVMVNVWKLWFLNS